MHSKTSLVPPSTQQWVDTRWIIPLNSQHLLSLNICIMILRQWKTRGRMKERLQSHCSVLVIQAFWHRMLPAHALSDPRFFLQQHVMTSDMSSTLPARETLSSLLAQSCWPSSFILENHQHQIFTAEPKSFQLSWIIIIIITVHVNRTQNPGIPLWFNPLL